MKSARWFFLIQGFLLFNCLWMVASYLIKSSALPSPIQVYLSLPNEIRNGLGIHFATSLGRLAGGITISVILGTVIGVFMGESDKGNSILNPVVYFTYPIPKLALLPVIMILFGLGNSSKLILIVLITVFPVIVAVRDAVKSIDPEYYNLLSSLGADKWQRRLQVTLPAIMTDLLTSIKISVGTTLSVLFFAENYGTSLGLGYYIQDSWMRIDYISMFSGITLLSGLGFALFAILDRWAEIYNRTK